jgi:hypothetical protein
MSYEGILFPDRAEDISQPNYTSYRVFLDFWQPLAVQLREFYEPVATRGISRMLLIHAPQGGGKTMFATKLANDFNITKTSSSVVSTADNLWHRISGGTASGRSTLNPTLISNATKDTSLISVTNDSSIPGLKIPENKDWITALAAKVSGQQNHRWIVIVDNAERGHFIQSLLDLSDADFMDRRDHPQTAHTAAQRFVGQARVGLRGCLFIVLTNSLVFSDSLEVAMESQHKGMLARTNLPLPGASEKETVIRVNTNRLNNISYWYCLDRAGPNEKVAVYDALNGAETFPGAFAAVDAALRSSVRGGRGAKKCVLSLVIFTKVVDQSAINALGRVWRSEVAHKWLSITNFDAGWADRILPSREAGLIESEWILRVIAIGEPFVKSLLSGNGSEEQSCNDLIEKLKKELGPGVHKATIEKNEAELEDIVDSWVNNSAVDIDRSFWSLGQRRSVVYEPILSRLQARYNQTSAGFLSYRPDLVISQFAPCSILSAASNGINDINSAIRRNAHTFEFTAIDDMTTAKIKGYLGMKLKNYAEVTQEQ